MGTKSNFMMAFVAQNYMKYIDMSRVTTELFANTRLANEMEINVYFDVSSMIEKMYNPCIFTHIQDPVALASKILNLGAHVRAFFKRYCGVYATIFFVYSRNEWEYYDMVFPRWNKRNLVKRSGFRDLNKDAKDTVDLLDVICPYLPDVYFIYRKAESTVVIWNTILKERALGNNHPNIVFTKQAFGFQLPCIDDKTFLYYKWNSNLQTYGINRSNVYKMFLTFTNRYRPIISDPDGKVLIRMYRDMLTHELKVKFDSSFNFERYYKNQSMIDNTDPQYMNIFMALAGLPKKGISALLSWADTMRFIIQHIQPDPSIIIDSKKIMAALDDYGCKLRNTKVIDFDLRIKLCTITYMNSIYDEYDESKEDYHRSLNNIDELHRINDMYFFKDPIRLNDY